MRIIDFEFVFAKPKSIFETVNLKMGMRSAIYIYNRYLYAMWCAISLAFIIITILKCKMSRKQRGLTFVQSDWLIFDI